MTNLQLINETIHAYDDESNRAIQGISDTCMYKTKNGEKCAIGRLMDENKLIEYKLSFEELNEIGNLSSLIKFLRKMNLTIYNILVDDVKDIPIELLDALQEYHDCYCNDATYIEELRGKYTERESVLN